MATGYPALAHRSPGVESADGKSRLAWVDVAKGICIIFVVMMHTTLGLEKAAGQIGWMNAVVAFAKPFRMPDFFMISGLFLSVVIARNWRKYLDRKVVHFFYFYVLWVAIQFAFKAPATLLGGEPATSIIQDFLITFVQPFGTLWFIYLLPVFFVVTKALRSVPAWALLGGAALLQIAPIHTEWVLLDEFCSRYVFFLGGYLFAANIFRLADWVHQNAWAAFMGVCGWAVLNGILVVTGFADLPLISLALGALGAMAIVAVAALLTRMNWHGILRTLGEHSIVVYLAFFLPMIVSRIAFLKFAPFIDVGTASAISTAIGVAAPMVFYIVINRLGVLSFLFKRPDWAYLRGTNAQPRAAIQPAE
ncbi:MAG: acyltransferase family protein [Pseudomonadota bacterium]